MKNAYGVSRSRDKSGKVVKRELKDYTMCIHASIGGGRENMWVLIAEEYEDTDICIEGERGNEYIQRLEIGREVSNTLTSVSKDNMIYEKNDCSNEDGANEFRQGNPEAV